MRDKTSCALPRPEDRKMLLRMKFSRIISGCPDGAEKRRMLMPAMLLHRKNADKAL